LDQHVHFKPGSTVHESALAAFGRLQQIEHEMHELEHRMADAGDDLEKVLERYSDLQQEFEHEGGFEYAARAEAILQGLGFEREMWSLETEKLSGGQQNRLGLACLLLAAPDLLLLDEPTNHLDLDSKEVLLDALVDYGGTLIFVSHDRYFVERLATKIIEIGGGSASVYPGTYAEFLWHKEHPQEQAPLPSPARAAAPQRPSPAPRGTAERPAARAAAAPVQPAAVQNRDEKKRLDAEARRRSRADDARQKKIGELESRIGVVESEIREIEQTMAAEGFYADRAAAQPVISRHQSLMWEVGDLMHRWEELQLGNDLSGAPEQ